MSPSRVLSAVVRVELRQLLRDHRAILAAVLLPAVLYPLLFMGQNAVQNLSRDTLAAREVHVAYDLSRAPAAEAARALALLASRTPIVLTECDATPLFELAADTALDDDVYVVRERDAVRTLFGGSSVLLITAAISIKLLIQT